MKKDKIVAYGIMSILIILFSILTFFISKDLFAYIDLKNNGIKGEAIIINVENNLQISRGSKRDIITLEYISNDEKYIIPVETHISLINDHKVGDTISVYYYPNNIDSIQTEINFITLVKTFISMVSMFILSIIIFILIIYLMMKKEKYSKRVVKYMIINMMLLIFIFFIIRFYLKSTINRKK